MQRDLSEFWMGYCQNAVLESLRQFNLSSRFLSADLRMPALNEQHIRLEVYD